MARGHQLCFRPPTSRPAQPHWLKTYPREELDLEIEKVKARLQARYSDAVADVLERHEAQRRGLSEELAQARQEAATPLSEAWGEWRNPVKYTTLEELGIDQKKLKFEAVPPPTTVLTPPPPPDRSKAGALTIAQAKAGLALQFSVPPEAIEILIKG